MTLEAERIRFLVERDGSASARRWVEEMLDTYRRAVTDPHSHASQFPYRSSFEESIREFEEWLAREQA